MTNQSTAREGLRLPFSVIAKPTGAACNLDCSYCFFLSKEVLWGHESQRMTSGTLDRFVHDYLASQPDGEVTISWQGGEPTLRGLEFFEEAVRLAERHRRPGQRVSQTIQTNGTLLDDAWGEFLAANRFLVGLSVDGPAHLHDRYRVNKAGRGSYSQVRRGWDVLRRHDVETNILCTVHAGNAAHPLDVYRHFRDELGARYLQFIPIVERVEPGCDADAERGYRDEHGNSVLYRQSGSGTTSRTVAPEAWGEFLCAIFDEWIRRDVGEVFVQHFDVMLGAVFGQYTLCVHSPECGRAVAMEHNGDVYSCDHYVEPDYRLGNVSESPFSELLALPQQQAFGRGKRTSLPGQCVECPVRWACHGGCPKDRFATTAAGEPGLNYLCAGYYRFFTHAQPSVEAMARLLRNGRTAADIMGVAPVEGVPAPDRPTRPERAGST
ncbi:Anaerobic sulfatase-maturating enzyme [Propionicimonas sp. T2.31MG-18]|uniref:anaerobic sulfatase maturase n=1 Tax=Propionicimonas sp. T2.31MG-18 TaxID=3157620 RepID=UPI0035EC47DB